MKDGKTCICCGKPKAKSAYYVSSSDLHADGLIPVCRKCIVNAAYDPDTDGVNVERFTDVLRQADKPFLPDVLASSEKQSDNSKSKTGIARVESIVGYYFKNLNSLNQYKKLRWGESTAAKNDPPDTSSAREAVYLKDDLDAELDKYGFSQQQRDAIKATYQYIQQSLKISDSEQLYWILEYSKQLAMMLDAIVSKDVALYCDCSRDSIFALQKLIELQKGMDTDFFDCLTTISEFFMDTLGSESYEL